MCEKFPIQIFCTEQIKKKAGTSQKVPKKGSLSLRYLNLLFIALS